VICRGSNPKSHPISEYYDFRFEFIMYFSVV
jgi:hypothetical protein